MRPELDRRGFCRVTGSALLLPVAVACRASAPPGYRSILDDGGPPARVRWNGRDWKIAGGPAWAPGMDHSIQLGEDRARFELRDTPSDRGRNDPPDKRRAELSGSIQKPRLPNGTELWGAMLFNHHRWQQPEAMARGQGGVHGQVHMGSKYGGSPAIAFRRFKNGNFRVTTRGERDPSGSIRHDAPLAFDAVHDLVYRFILDPDGGALTVWLDGRRIVEVSGVSIGSRFAESYWNIGLYYAGGIANPIVAEYARHVYPGPSSLAARVDRPPTWPAA